MRFPLTSLVRLCALSGLALFASAVGLSRAVPKPASFRAAVHPRFHGVNGLVLDPPDRRNFLLDSETGALRPFDPVPGYRVDFVSCSPWCDERGGVEVVARVTGKPGDASSSAFNGSALVRFPFSGGRLRSEAPGGPAIGGHVSWLNGSPSRLVFPGGDGALYVQDIARSGDPTEPDGAGSPPRPVAWRTALPDGGRLSIADSVCPAVPALGGRLLVALSSGLDVTDRRRLGTPQIWWLKLDPQGTSVVAAGRLTPPEEAPGAARVFERFPNLGVTPDGRAVLTYLTRESSASTWRLKVAPVTFDGPDGAPVVRPSTVRDLGDGFAAAAPVFTRDGRSIFQVVRRPEGEANRVRRFSVAAALEARPTSAAELAVAPRSAER